MEPFDLALEGGRVATEWAVCDANVYVRDGKIAAVVGHPLRLPSRDTFDASGLVVMPGVIDAHTHFRTSTGHCDDFETLTKSAAYGGVTTTLAFIMGMNAGTEGFAERVERYVKAAERDAWTDYAFHAGLAAEPDALAVLDRVVALGIRSFKMFMTYRSRGMMVDDGFMYAAMGRVRALGGIAMVHAETGDVIDALASTEEVARLDDEVDRLLAARPAWVEIEAVRRALELAARTDCPVYLVHLSSDRSVRDVIRARARGVTAFAETCPQYLNLSTNDFHRLGGLAKIAPPLRTDEGREKLLDVVMEGLVDVVASDHSPYSINDKAGRLEDAPWGAPGTETMIGATWRAISSRGADVCSLVRLVSSNPARIFGLYPQKGCIAPGSDADLTVLDLQGRTEVIGEGQHNRSGYSVYDTWELPLRVRATFLRGLPLFDGVNIAKERFGKPVLG